MYDVQQMNSKNLDEIKEILKHWGDQKKDKQKITIIKEIEGDC